MIEAVVASAARSLRYVRYVRCVGWRPRFTSVGPLFDPSVLFSLYQLRAVVSGFRFYILQAVNARALFIFLS